MKSKLAGISQQARWVAGFAAVLLMGAGIRGIAAPTTFNLSGPVTYVSPADMAQLGLLGFPSIGDTIHASITYDGAMLPTQSLPGFLNFIPPADTASTQISLNGFSADYVDNYFQAILRPNYTNEINGKLQYGDDAVLFAYGPPVSASNPLQVNLYVEVMFPSGTFDGTAVLPDLPPAWTYISLGVNDGAGNSATAQSLGEIGKGISPVPEPATYGATGALVLLGLIAKRKLRNRTARY